jgi:4-carboxymuconolactone decarboxylase
MRIRPVDPPYDDALLKWMPPGADVEPLLLFRTIAVHPSLSGRMRVLGAGLLGHPTISPGEREAVILHTCRRAGCEYEWGVHATFFHEQPPSDRRRALLVRLVDELHDTDRVSNRLWAELAGEWEQPQLLELLVLHGWYRLIAGVANGARLPLEPWAERFASEEEGERQGDADDDDRPAQHDGIEAAGQGAAGAAAHE